MAGKSATRTEIEQTRAAMCIAFPECFAPKGTRKRPLKVGIGKDLMEVARTVFPGLSRRLINAFLRDYTSGFRYRSAIERGATRIDLVGNLAGVVTEAEAAHAEGEIRKIQDRKKQGHRRAGPVAVGAEIAE